MMKIDRDRFSYSLCKAWFRSKRAFFSDSSCSVDDRRIFMSSRNPIAISSSEASLICLILTSKSSLVVTSWKRKWNSDKNWFFFHLALKIGSKMYGVYVEIKRNRFPKKFKCSRGGNSPPFILGYWNLSSAAIIKYLRHYGRH